ncbi:MAG: hypothetical protein RLZZ387_1505 [Chloroflexota bacterium]|jgi:hypothetical protein
MMPKDSTLDSAQKLLWSAPITPPKPRSLAERPLKE